MKKKYKRRYQYKNALINVTLAEWKIDKHFKTIWKFAAYFNTHFPNMEWSGYKKMDGWVYISLISEGENTGLIVSHRRGGYHLSLVPNNRAVKGKSELTRRDTERMIEYFLGIFEKISREHNTEFVIHSLINKDCITYIKK